MMKKSLLLKLFAAFMALTFIVASLASCGKKSVTDGAFSEEGDLEVVGTVGDYEVLYDEFRYVVLSCKDELASKYGEHIWEDDAVAATYEPELSAMVMSRITANYAVLALCEKYGYENPLGDKENIDRVDATIDELLYTHAINTGIRVEVSESLSGKLKYKYEGGGLDDAYDLLREELAYLYLTERVVRLTLGVEYAFEVLINILTVGNNEVVYKDEDVAAFIESDKFICTRHIFVQNDPGESIENNRAIAEYLLEQYNNGTPFEQLIGGKYNDDFSTPYEGAYFTRGEMETAYEDASFSLEVGEVSGIVVGEDGFYIIQRCEKNPEYMQSNFETFADQITYAAVNTIVREYQKTLSITLNEYGSSLVLYKIPSTWDENQEN